MLLDHQRKIKRALIPVFITYFLDNFGLAIIYPIFTPLLFGTESLIPQATPYSERTILLGLLIASFPLAQFFGAPLLGQFSDRFGRKKSFYITIFGTMIGYALTAISLHFHSLFCLFISRFTTGFFAGNLTICLAAIADLSHDDVSRTRNFSLISVAGGLSFIIAIAFGGILSDPSLSALFNPEVPFWIIAFFSLINLLIMIQLFHETHKGPSHPGINPLKGMGYLLQSIQSKELLILYAVNFLYKLAWVACMQFLPVFLIVHFKFSVNAITLALMGAGALWSLSNLIINRKLAEKFYAGKLLLWSLFLLALLLLFTQMVHTPSSFLLLFFLAVSFAALCWTNVLAVISLKAPLSIQGSVLGINQSVTSIATMVSPIIGGMLAALHKNAIYTFSGAECLLAFLLLFFCKAYEQHSTLD